MYKDDKLTIGGREFSSRLFLGTGKFSSPQVMRDALAQSGASVATVALKRANLGGGSDASADIAEWLEPDKYLVLPNTSGAVNADEAVRIARLGRAAGFGDFVKLEIHPDPNYLLPDPIDTLEATKILSKDGFKVMAYINADPVLALRLQDAGAGRRHAAGRANRHKQGRRDARTGRNNHRAVRRPRCSRRGHRASVARGGGHGNGGGSRHDKHCGCGCVRPRRDGEGVCGGGRGWAHGKAHGVVRTRGFRFGDQALLRDSWSRPQ